MSISDFLDLANVHVGMRVRDKARLLADLADLAAPAVAVPAGDISAALARREALGSTGLGGGIALPHARMDAIARPFGLLCTLKAPIPFEAVDDNPVDIVVLLLLPTGPAGAQLGALASVARRLREQSVVDSMRQARGALEAYALLAGGH